MNQLSCVPDVGCVYIPQADYELPVNGLPSGCLYWNKSA